MDFYAKVFDYRGSILQYNRKHLTAGTCIDGYWLLISALVNSNGHIFPQDNSHVIIRFKQNL